MKTIAKTTFALLASTMMMVACKNAERSETTSEGTTIEDDANGNIGNSDVTTSPGTNVDQTSPNGTGATGTTGGTGTGSGTGTATDTVPRTGSQSTNNTTTGGR